MTRDPDQLTHGRFDVLIVGAGIYGATIARESALRGLRTALIEAGDFGGATSANSLKVVHGGLRYLQRLDWRQMRESIRARRRLLRLAPHLVKPLRVAVPTLGLGLLGRPVMAAALALNEIASCDRNRGAPTGRRLPRAYTVNRGTASALLPGLPPASFDGAAIWFDALAEDTERLCLGFVQAAIAHGAVACNYLRGERLLQEHGNVTGVAARDLLTGSSHEIHAGVTVDATGPWCGRLEGWPLPEAATPRRWVRAVNVFVRRPLVGDSALGLAGRPEYRDRDDVLHKGSRFYFFVPWRGGTLIGTDYHDAGANLECRVTARQLRDFLAEVNFAFPAAQLDESDIAFCHCGLLPARTRGAAADPAGNLLKRSCIADSLQFARRRGLIAVVGTKYTTAVETAVLALNLAQVQLGDPVSALLADPPLPGAEAFADLPPDSWLDALAARARTRLWRRYGNLGEKVYACGDSAKPDQTLPASVVLESEVIHAVRHEMARHLADVVFRRTDLGAAGTVAGAALERCADLVAAELRWDPATRNAELDAVRRETARRGPAAVI